MNRRYALLGIIAKERLNGNVFKRGLYFPKLYQSLKIANDFKLIPIIGMGIKM